MNEFSIGYLSAGNVGVLALASVLYMLGGRAGGPGKAVRRFVASALIAASINITALLIGNWSPWLIGVYPILIGAFCLGYGGHSMPRIIQRGLVTLVLCIAGVLCCFALGGGWWLIPVQAIVGISTVIFAANNPIMASAEEVLVCVLLNAIMMFYPFIGVLK